MMNSSVRTLLLGAVLVCGLIGTILPVGAQSNDMLDRILAESELSYGSAAWLALRATDRIADSATGGDSVARLDALGYGIAHRAPDETISLGEYSFLLMRLFELDGGILYRLMPGPRYATRELVAARIVQGNAYSSMVLSGERSVRILARTIAFRDGERL